ncbi:MAG: heavy metal translocating P-type ATPase, partial [Candidatus Latescibacteria bacterium]|nr:heavy metal translocating P-type ATPase [Candidatus Latescibacterota bacterium]
MPSGSVARQFTIHGMDCAEEIAILKREVGPVVGGEEHLSFDLLHGRMTILTGPGTPALEAILQAIARTGMQGEIWREGSETPSEAQGWQRHGRTILTGASGLSLVAGFLVHAWMAGGIGEALGAEGLEHQVPPAAAICYALGILAGVWLILPKAWLAARRLRPDMNLLMTVAVLGAIGIGEWLEAASVSFLFSVSLLLESWSVGRARRAVGALMELAPTLACLKRADGSEEQVSPDQVPVGAVFMVKPGERIPLDGRVVRGVSEVNQAPITGESGPVFKDPGAQVFAGTINGDGALEIESAKPAADTTLAQIVRMVGEAQRQRAPVEQWVEKFAQIYTPVVMSLAIAVLLVPPLFFSATWGEWLYRSLVLLVIACPCALVISTPVSMVAALAAAARNGVLVKGGKYLEFRGQVRAMALDKTGTLTQGKPQVVELVPLGGHDEGELLERALAMEAPSGHPLARAIVAFAQERGMSSHPAEEFQLLQGKGATARFNGNPYWVGSHRFLEERGQETQEIHERLEAMAKAGQTVVVVGNDTHVCGLIALADAVRPEARQALQALRTAGVRRLVMLTGDNEGTAQAIGTETGIDQVFAELLPAQKEEAVASLVSQCGQVAMVGDGINDAPAMARATVGIAMGAAGSDAAIETADIALMSDDLAKLPWLIRHSRRTLGIVR